MKKKSGMYYTPREIADPAAGSGGFLRAAADYVLSNPPYSVTFTAPQDKSLEAFKSWLKQMSEKMGAKQTMTAAEIKAAWREFWAE